MCSECACRKLYEFVVIQLLTLVKTLCRPEDYMIAESAPMEEERMVGHDSLWVGAQWG